MPDTRHVLPPDADAGWFRAAFGSVPVLEVTLEHRGGGTRSGRLIPPEPDIDPATGEPALWMEVPGKLHPDPIPLAQVEAVVVHAPDPPPPLERESLRTLPRFVFDLLTRREPAEPWPRPVPVTEADPVYFLAQATAGCEDDAVDAVTDAARRAVEPALLTLPDRTDHEFVAMESAVRVNVLLRLPNGPDRSEAERAVMDAAAATLEPIGRLPGVTWMEVGQGDW